jgi:hypothetical protein
MRIALFLTCFPHRLLDLDVLVVRHSEEHP